MLFWLGLTEDIVLDEILVLNEVNKTKLSYT